MALCSVHQPLLTLLLCGCLEVVFRLTFLSYLYKGDQFVPLRTRRELITPWLGVGDAHACSALLLHKKRGFQET